MVHKFTDFKLYLNYINAYNIYISVNVYLCIGFKELLHQLKGQYKLKWHNCKDDKYYKAVTDDD